MRARFDARISFRSAITSCDAGASGYQAGNQKGHDLAHGSGATGVRPDERPVPGSRLLDELEAALQSPWIQCFLATTDEDRRALSLPAQPRDGMRHLEEASVNRDAIDLPRATAVHAPQIDCAVCTDAEHAPASRPHASGQAPALKNGVIGADVPISLVCGDDEVARPFVTPSGAASVLPAAIGGPAFVHLTSRRAPFVEACSSEFASRPPQDPEAVARISSDLMALWTSPATEMLAAVGVSGRDGQLLDSDGDGRWSDQDSAARTSPHWGEVAPPRSMLYTSAATEREQPQMAWSVLGRSVAGTAAVRSSPKQDAERCDAEQSHSALTEVLLVRCALRCHSSDAACRLQAVSQWVGDFGHL